MKKPLSQKLLKILKAFEVLVESAPKYKLKTLAIDLKVLHIDTIRLMRCLLFVTAG